MDNFKFDITSVGDYSLAHAISVALTDKYGKQTSVVGWKEDPEKGLILYKYARPEIVPFLSPLDHKALVPVISAWLVNQDYGREPDHDGCNSKGFRIYNEAWGRIGSDHATICAIKPEWAWHGK